MTERKFYRTVVEIEILSEEPYSNENLSQIAYDITEGDCSGAYGVVNSETVDGKTMAEMLLNQGSDPGFFMLDEEGNDTEDC